MFSLIHIASGGEGLWGLIVVIVIVSQIVRAVKKAAQSGADQSGAGTPKPFLDADEELQSFLRSLGGEKAVPPPPPPSPQPRRVPTPSVPAAAPRVVAPKATPKPATAPRSRPTAASAAAHRRVASQRSPVPPPLARQVVKANIPLPPAPAPARASDDIHADAYAIVEHGALQKVAVEALRRTIQQDLVSTTLLRKGIVLREILGPPIALRQNHL